MQEFLSQLNYYTEYYTRYARQQCLSRGRFNLIFFIIFLPPVFIEYAYLKPVIEEAVGFAMRTMQPPVAIIESYHTPIMVDLLNFVAWAVLVPVFMMRCNDIKWPYWTIAICYLPQLNALLKNIDLFTLPWYLTSLPAFVVVSLLCGKASVDDKN